MAEALPGKEPGRRSAHVHRRRDPFYRLHQEPAEVHCGKSQHTRCFQQFRERQAQGGRQMKPVTRRDFLQQLGAAAAVLTLGRSTFSGQRVLPSSGGGAFEMLVVGDSHISGQGLVKEHKTYYLVKEWLEREYFRNSRP